MKQCPECKQDFDDSRTLCETDGAKLLPVASDRSNTTDLMIGLTIDGKYRLERRIGRGGMGAVYIANHTKFNKQLAIKVLSPEMMEDSRAVERFQREANASARFKHPNAVTVSDFGQTPEGIAYLVMEFIDGVSLRRLMDREKRLAPARVVDIGKQICAAIAAAHRVGIIHRDLKPDNVMIEIIDGREVARVLDFGIAKIRDAQQGQITRTDSVLGTPHYMSPEQCSGGTLDQRSDIYALGVLLYEMLCGETPFQAATAPAIIVQHVTKDPIPVDKKWPEVPATLSHIVMRALEKQPSRRQQSATKLSEELSAALKLANIPHEAPKLAAGYPTGQWQVLFHGLLDDSEEGRKRLLNGLKKNFNTPLEKAQELIDGPRPRSVKKSTSYEEARRMAERLRVIGADVKIEEVLSDAPYEQPTVKREVATDVVNMKTVVAKSKPENTPETQHHSPEDQAKRKNVATMADNIPLDPLVMMDGNEMLSYVTEQVRSKAKATDPLKAATSVEEKKSTTEPMGDRGTTEMPSETKVMPPVAIDSWSIDINGMIYDNMSENDVEAWIRAGRVRHTHRVRQGKGSWLDIAKVPAFRRIIEQINPHVFQPLSAMEFESKKDEQEHAGRNFFKNFAKLGAVIFVLYIVIGFTMQYSQRRLLEDDLRVILADTKTTINTLRGRVDTALQQRSLSVPKENVYITVNPNTRNVTVRIDYKRTLLGIPFSYQVKRQIGNFNLTLDELARLPDGEVDIAGLQPGEIDAYRRKAMAKQISDKMSNYQGEPETLKEQETIKTELQEFERSLSFFDVTSMDEAGKLVYPKSVKIRDKEFTKDEVKARVEELKVRLGDVEHILREQRTSKQQEIERQTQKNFSPRGN